MMGSIHTERWRTVRLMRDRTVKKQGRKAIYTRYAHVVVFTKASGAAVAEVEVEVEDEKTQRSETLKAKP